MRDKSYEQLMRTTIESLKVFQQMIGETEVLADETGVPLPETWLDLKRDVTAELKRREKDELLAMKEPDYKRTAKTITV